MKESILKGRWILGINDDADFLKVLKKNHGGCSKLPFRKGHEIKIPL